MRKSNGGSCAEKIKWGVKVQIRPYDSNGNYEGIDDDNCTLQVKSASAEEVMKVAGDAISSYFGSKN